MAGVGSPRGLPVEPKQISSRLLNMKFMQRAAASDKSKPSSTPQTPAGEHPPKRRRTGDHLPSNRDSTASTPTTANHSSLNDRFAEPISFSPGSELPSHNLKTYAGEHYETEWVLDVHLPSTNGHGRQSQDSNYDSSVSSDDIWSPSLPSGVQTYGAFKKNPKSSTKPVSISKSARRNQKRNASDADLSSLSSNSDINSDSEASDQASDNEPNTYNTSRTNQARYKANQFESRSKSSNPSSIILGRDHHQLNTQTDQSDFLEFDATEHGYPTSNSNSNSKSKAKSKDKDKNKNRNGDYTSGIGGRISIGGGDGNNRNRNAGGGGGGGGRKKKRKTM